MKIDVIGNKTLHTRISRLLWPICY